MHPELCRNAARFHIQQADTLDSNIRICLIKVENEVCYGYPTPQRACESELSVNGGRRFLGYRSAELFDASNSNAEYSRSLRVPFLNHFRHPVLLKHRNAHVRLHLCPLHIATLLLSPNSLLPVFGSTPLVTPWLVYASFPKTRSVKHPVLRGRHLTA